MVIVVLHQRQRLLDAHVGSERRTHPVMNESVRNFNRPIARPKLRDDVSLLHLQSSSGVEIGPEKCAADRSATAPLPLPTARM